MSATGRGITCESLRGGQLYRISLANPPRNILDHQMISDLSEVLTGLPRTGPAKCVLIDHEGPNFCVGASVEEHLPGRAAQMLAGLHAFVRVLVGSPLYTVAAVRGFCLGGGLEVALCAGRVVAAPGAQLGAPEVKLGVFAPAASVLLPLRVGPAAAAELLCSGRVVGASEAEEFGLVDAVATDPTVAALEWFDHALAPHSAVAVRAAWGACRGTYRDAVSGPLDARERQYLDELMPHLDAQEGLAAFLDKRLPQWVHQ